LFVITVVDTVNCHYLLLEPELNTHQDSTVLLRHWFCQLTDIVHVTSLYYVCTVEHKEPALAYRPRALGKSKHNTQGLAWALGCWAICCASRLNTML